MNIVSALFMAKAHDDGPTVVQRIAELSSRADTMAVLLLANWFRQTTVHKHIPREDCALLERTYRSKEDLENI